MKIAIVTPGGVDRSGCERVIPCLLWLIERLVRAGVEVHVFALRQEPLPGRWMLLGATIHNLGTDGMTALSRALRSENAAGRFDLVHCFWALPSGAAAALPARMLGIPMLLTLPGGDLSSDRRTRYGGRLRWRDRLKLRLIVAASSGVTVPSAPMRSHAAALGIDTVRIPLGVALDRWPLRLPVRRDRARPVRLLHVASLNAVKDQATLLAAAARLRARQLPFELQVVGEDTLKGAVQRNAEALGLSGCMRFHGFLPQAQLRGLVEQADLMLVTSRHEAGPLVSLEAAIAGVPTVGTAVGNIAEMAPHAAVAVPVGGADALADAILALANDEDARLALASAAQARAVAENADFTARQFLTLYRQLAPRRSGAERIGQGRAAHAAL